VSLTHPLLPEAIDMVRIHGIDVGDAAVDLTLHRYSGSVGVDVERRVGRVDVVVNN
jgi:hypothetical protein